MATSDVPVTSLGSTYASPVNDIYVPSTDYVNTSASVHDPSPFVNTAFHATLHNVSRPQPPQRGDEDPDNLPRNLSDSKITGTEAHDQTDKPTPAHDEESGRENDQGVNSLASTSSALGFAHSLFQTRRPAPLPVFSHSTRLAFSYTQLRTRSRRASVLTVPLPDFDVAPSVALPSSDGEGNTTLEEGNSTRPDEDNPSASSEAELGVVRASRDFLVPELHFEPSPARTEATEIDEASRALIDFESSSSYAQESPYPRQPTRVRPSSFFHPRPAASTPFTWVHADESSFEHHYESSRYTDPDGLSDIDDYEHGHAYELWNSTGSLPGMSLPRTGSPNTLLGPPPAGSPYWAQPSYGFVTPPAQGSDWETPEPFEDAGHWSRLLPEHFNAPSAPASVQRELSPFGGPINLADDAAENEAGDQGGDGQEEGDMQRARPIEIRQLATSQRFVRAGILSPSPEEFLSRFRRDRFRSSLDDLPAEQVYDFHSETPTPGSMHGDLLNLAPSPTYGSGSGDYSHFPSIDGADLLSYPPAPHDQPLPSTELAPTHPFLADGPYAPYEPPQATLSPAAPIEPSAYTSQNDSLGSLPDVSAALRENTLAPLYFPPRNTGITLPSIEHIAALDATIDTLSIPNPDPNHLRGMVRRSVMNAPWSPEVESQPREDRLDSTVPFWVEAERWRRDWLYTNSVDDEEDRATDYEGEADDEEDYS